MPSKKPQPKRPADGGPVMVILEEIRSQNRATIEAVEASRGALEGKVDALATEIRSDVRMLQGAVQGNSADIRQLKAEVAALKDQLSRLDSVITTDYRERLQRVEQRLDALERRSA